MSSNNWGNFQPKSSLLTEYKFQEAKTLGSNKIPNSSLIDGRSSRKDHKKQRNTYVALPSLLLCVNLRQSFKIKTTAPVPQVYTPSL